MNIPTTQIEGILRGRSRPSLQDTLECGAILLDEIYKGEPDGWNQRNSVSLTQLSESLGVSTSTLYRYMSVATMWRQCGEPTLSHVGISHLRELLPLRPRAQKTLLLRAEKNKLTVAQVREAAFAYQRRPESVGRGRPRNASGYRTALQHIRKWSSTVTRLKGVEAIDLLTEPEAQEYFSLVTVARAELLELEEALQKRLHGS